MNAERLKKVEEIYHAALEVASDERDAFFNSNCSNDDNLRLEVESLLYFKDSTGSFLETPPESLAAEMFALKVDHASLVGKEIEHYKIKTLLGKGGMGEVYLAEDKNLNRQVALKFLPAELTGNADRLNRFEREAQTASGLNHPNILTIHQFGSENENRYIVTEFVDGETLSDAMIRGQLDLSVSLDIARQVAAALAAAHEAGIIHRDIKPDNVMIRSDGLVKVLDFGLAKLIEKPGSVRHSDSEAKTQARVETNPGAVMGTADYMSPEQARGLAVDARTDIFSFGVMLFQMITGQNPFKGETVNHTIVNILEKAVPSATSIREDCPAELEAIVKKCLSKKPDGRFLTSKELLSNLKRLQRRIEFEIELEKSSQPNLTTEAKTRVFDVPSNSLPPPNNLTKNLSPIIGRKKEVADLSGLLRQAGVRVLTMTGTGGTGKTRLAQTIAEEMLDGFEDGVFFVALAPVRDFKLVIPIIAQTIGIKETGAESALDALKNHLREKHMLLVLDNFEQVIGAAPDIAEIAAAAADVKIVITSREPLHITAECEYAVGPLAVPEEISQASFDDLSDYEAVRFFVERARFSKPDFEMTDENCGSVAQICQRLEGLPLAIELAAARVKLFSPQAILTRLSHSLHLLTGGERDLPERQQTMRATIAWSYDLLSQEEKDLFTRLAVFSGGFSLDGAQAVALEESSSERGTSSEPFVEIYDGISSLLDKSLVIRTDQADGEPRFRMLVVVKEFALERLEESRKTEEIERRHAEFYTVLTAKADPESRGANAAEWIRKLEAEHENLRYAVKWASENNPLLMLQLVSTLHQFWLRSGNLSEGYEALAQALELGDDKADPKLLVKVYGGISSLAWNMGKKTEAVGYAKNCLRISREIGDKHLIVVALHKLASAEFMLHELSVTQDLVEEGLTLAREIDDFYEIATLSNLLGEIARIREDYETAKNHYDEMLFIARRKEYKPLIVMATVNLGAVACLMGDYRSSRSYSLESMRMSEELGDKLSVGYNLERFAALSVINGTMAKAARLNGAMDTIYETAGYEVEEVDRIFLERYLLNARAAIGEEAFESAYAEGRAMSLEQAAALARTDESDTLEAVHTTGEVRKHTNVPTVDVAESLKVVSAQHNSKTTFFSRHGFLSKFTKLQAMVVALSVVLLATAGFFSYRYFIATNQISSIAVLPFINESGNPELEYLSDGMTEMLINRLSQLPDLSVKARASVFRYKGKSIDLKRIASELNVDAILTGRVQQRGDQMILNLELIDPQTENVLWGNIYERDSTDLATLQIEVAHDVSSRLVSKISGAEAARVEKTYTPDNEAYQLYLKGRYHWNKRNISDFEKAAEFFEQAVKKDPNFALAYTGLADTFALMPLYGDFKPGQYMPKAKQSALKAIELDQDLAEAHASLAYIINSYDYDWKGAEREYKKAIKLNPNYATAHQWYAEHLAYKGRSDLALVEISKALELDPFSLVINRIKGNILGFADRHDEAIAQLRKTEEFYPENALVKFNLADAYAAKGLHDEAVRQYLVALKMDGKGSEEIQEFRIAYKDQGWKGFWLKYLNSLLKEQSLLQQNGKNANSNNEHFAFVYAATGNKEKAIEYLNNAYRERDPNLITINTSPVYDFLRSDPRHRELYEKIGLRY